MDRLDAIAHTLRRDIIEMMHNSSAGHVGGDLSVVDILTTLYFEIMNVDPERRDDPDRDRFLLSKGHCADALYCVLGERGYYDKKEAVKTFSQFGSRFIGHPNTGVPGIELNSGSLGHGISAGVGMALAAKMDGRGYRTYVVAGDGEMAEGSNYEGMMAAAHYKLDNLCVIIDHNGLQIDGPNEKVMSLGSIPVKLQAFGLETFQIDGHDFQAMDKAFYAARQVKGRPSAIILETTKGKGVSYMEGQVGWHGKAPNDEEYAQGMSELNAALAELEAV